MTRGIFSPMLLQAQQDGLSEQAHGDVVTQPAPGADFVFVQSHVGLGALYCEFFAGRSVDRLSDCSLAISDSAFSGSVYLAGFPASGTGKIEPIAKDFDTDLLTSGWYQIVVKLRWQWEIQSSEQLLYRTFNCNCTL